MSGAEAHSVAARVHGTYLLAPPAAGPARALVVGFHGYGELAETHLEALRSIPGAAGWLLCAVQALHPFYRRNGEVVASWMTRFDRERAIADNVAYVASVVTAVRADHPAVERLAFIGFSQGASMAYRAAAFSGHRADAVVALAGDVPPEVAADGLGELPPTLVGAGNRDRWFGAAEMSRDVALLRAAGVEATEALFDGGHEWADGFRERAGEFLARRLAPGDAG